MYGSKLAITVKIEMEQKILMVELK